MWNSIRVENYRLVLAHIFHEMENFNEANRTLDTYMDLQDIADTSVLPSKRILASKIRIKMDRDSENYLHLNPLMEEYLRQVSIDEHCVAEFSYLLAYTNCKRHDAMYEFEVQRMGTNGFLMPATFYHQKALKATNVRLPYFGPLELENVTNYITNYITEHL